MALATTLGQGLQELMAPQAAVGEGLRNIIYLGGGAFDVGVPRLFAWGCAGLAALAVGVLVPTRKIG